MTSRDVLVIGAGAAGATAAFHLAKAGIAVTLVDKNATGSFKPCGGGMAAAVQQWFPFELTPIIDQVIKQVDFSWCLNDPVIAELPGSSPFWIVKREKLDSFLTDHAVQAGAELLCPFEVIDLHKEENTWRVTSKDKREIHAKAVIIADGSNSPWPSLYGLGPMHPHHAVTTSVRLEGQGNLAKGTTRFEFGLVHHGFAWAFPLENGLNIGIGTFIGKNAVNAETVLEQLLPDLGFNPDEGRRQSASLRVWNGHHDLHGDGIVAIGDAASLCDPFLAEGIRPALMSGFEAAIALKKWLHGETSDLSGYSQVMKSKWGESMAWGKRIAQVFYRFPRVGYQLGIKRPTAPQRIAQILSGEMGYGEIAQRVIKRLLLRQST